MILSLQHILESRRKTERNKVLEAEMSTNNNNNMWLIVSSEWVYMWRDFILGGELNCLYTITAIGKVEPPVIDNRNLYDASNIKLGLVENVDYFAVNPKVWMCWWQEYHSNIIVPY